MFTLEQIKTAHSKVKSGADFPSYIQEIKTFGVTHYEAYVADGQISYHGLNDYTVNSPSVYTQLIISDLVEKEAFQSDLIAHQQGKTDFPTFLHMCASYGIEKWIINMDKMTCTYFDKAGNEILTEVIPH